MQCSVITARDVFNSDNVFLGSIAIGALAVGADFFLKTFIDAINKLEVDFISIIDSKKGDNQKKDEDLKSLIATACNDAKNNNSSSSTSNVTVLYLLYYITLAVLGLVTNYIGRMLFCNSDIVGVGCWILYINKFIIVVGLLWCAFIISKPIRNLRKIVITKKELEKLIHEVYKDPTDKLMSKMTDALSLPIKPPNNTNH